MESYYSGLLFVLPLTLVGCGVYLARRGRDAALSLLCVTSCVGLLLLITKFRLQNFGSFALFLPGLCLLEHAVPASSARRVATLLGATLLLGLAWAQPVTKQLFKPQWLGWSPAYALTSDIYPALHDACAARAGIVLASSDDGHYIRYHSECSVIADNFMLTRQDADSLAQTRALLSLTPQQLLAAPLDVRYVYARLDLVDHGPANGGFAGGSETEVRANNLPLVNALIFTPLDQIDPHYRLVKELRFTGRDTYPYARLFSIQRDSAPTARATAP